MTYIGAYQSCNCSNIFDHFYFFFDQNLGGRIKDGHFDQISEFNNMPRKLERKLILFELNKTLKDFALDSQETTKDFQKYWRELQDYRALFSQRTLISKSKDGKTFYDIFLQ